jgi:hypothetical protein
MMIGIEINVYTDLVVEWPEKDTEFLHNIACIDAEIVTEDSNRHVLLNLRTQMLVRNGHRSMEASVSAKDTNIALNHSMARIKKLGA